MDSTTQTDLQHLALALQQGGAIAKAVAHYHRCTKDPLPVVDMMLAQKTLCAAITRHAIPCTADLGCGTPAGCEDDGGFGRGMAD